MYDVLIIGGGVAGMSCALMLGSAKKQLYAKDKKIGIIIHQRTSSLQNALFNNVLGLSPNTTGASILKEGKDQLSTLYPHVTQINNEKVLKVEQHNDKTITVYSNKSSFKTKNIVVAVGPKNFAIKGLEEFVELHSKLTPEKERTQLKNSDHLVTSGIYVAGVLAGHRSQYAIAAGSGTSVATDILCNWNAGKPVKIHDSIIIE
ncbi:FAD-dependent oxidoreductase [Urechidicola croceus]|uniref:Pyridine nucleotide-disulfide oxidoreductase n=1 Tax=Urechidicola croceus TaxID=1850246 RepID=A0A1D8P909_9FLAO|nr:FAD-dependent oxidoreductase [Urechidicola croceus]AOW21019.1 pyridine nucleotide-disulfide oxidoreductase [Urechidicola croceus]